MVINHLNCSFGLKICKTLDLRWTTMLYDLRIPGVDLTFHNFEELFRGEQMQTRVWLRVMTDRACSFVKKYSSSKLERVRERTTEVWYLILLLTLELFWEFSKTCQRTKVCDVNNGLAKNWTKLIIRNKIQVINNKVQRQNVRNNQG